MQNRLKATGLAAGVALIGVLRAAIGLVKLITEIAKIIFYSVASLFTFGNYENLKRLKTHCKLLILNAANLLPNTTQPSFIASKIQEIKNQYEKAKANEDLFKIDMIGHSMGSNLIQNVLTQNKTFQIRRAITVGTPFFSQAKSTLPP